jgi:hypothetical protein
MRRASIACIAFVACLALAPVGQAIAAGKLPIPVAAKRAAAFAKRTCDHDESCVRSGVANCKRQKPRVVLCRIFIRRHTDAQGRYHCTRLVRLIPAHKSDRPKHAKVNGLGHWQC